MDVVGHQTIADDGDVKGQTLVGEHAQIEPAIVIGEECAQPVYSVPCNVMGKAGYDDASLAGHAVTLREPQLRSPSNDCPDNRPYFP